MGVRIEFIPYPSVPYKGDVNTWKMNILQTAMGRFAVLWTVMGEVPFPNIYVRIYTLDIFKQKPLQTFPGWGTWEKM
jgi:hypothetical protein